MSGKSYTPDISIRKRAIDGWYGAECPDCGASIIDKTVPKVEKGTEKHGDKEHNWAGINFREV